MAVTRAASKTVPKQQLVSQKASKSVKGVSRAASKTVDRTEDGHHIIVNGRKWRATDPLIPEEELKELKHYLALGRSDSRRTSTKSDDAIKAARQYTGLAKHGLGERGQPEWWKDTEEGRRRRWEDAIKDLRALEAKG